MVEATFELAVPKPITSGVTKYSYCVAHITHKAAAIFRDVIVFPDRTDPYKHFTEVIKTCGESKTLEICHLLTGGEQLGDRKPSEFLCVTQRRAETHKILDSLLLELFLQQLSNNVQLILLTNSPLTDTKAAEIADRMMEVQPPEVNKKSAPNSSPKWDNTNSQSELLEEVRALRREIASLGRSRSICRSHNSFRIRSHSPSLSKYFCWYHHKFNSMARKCIQTCSIPGNADLCFLFIYVMFQKQ
ncbi:hypothetical protein AVEN_164820-1 [Araneus ventricosus]|uniref:DUF7041 domain-containing protein n=1 Tax=Araneus ventricosus TaxID=182803 RepID=A0A4Y2B222_ARAVE|nr:hypothetical protein AVEN_33251-1 [Araneus ventricosus]GBL86016.1 hypothetical protein AVEN_38547-1 [Araneus ventricosus]GBL86028.1 hypothetical protein AVEN_105041-1 [Araneus ventricosus]GBL86044.1 hypothetical protein AVEN_164820-1 [Araneus ventricosus]